MRRRTIDLRELLERGRLHDVEDADDLENKSGGVSQCAAGEDAVGTRVFVDACLGEELEELELAQGAETKESVLERQDLFDGDFAAGGLVHGCDDDAVRALAEAVKHTVVVAWESGQTYVRQLAGMGDWYLIHTDFEFGQRLSGFAGRHGARVKERIRK